MSAHLAVNSQIFLISNMNVLQAWMQISSHTKEALVTILRKAVDGSVVSACFEKYPQPDPETGDLPGCEETTQLRNCLLYIYPNNSTVIDEWVYLFTRDISNPCSITTLAPSTTSATAATTDAPMLVTTNYTTGK